LNAFGNKNKNKKIKKISAKKVAEFLEAGLDSC
jgi:hypothetical protein